MSAPQDEPKNGRRPGVEADYVIRANRPMPPVKDLPAINKANEPKDRDKVSSGRGAY